MIKEEVGVHWFWWLFWAVMCFPVMIITAMIHINRISKIRKFNEEQARQQSEFRKDIMTMAASK